MCMIGQCSALPDDPALVEQGYNFFPDDPSFFAKASRQQHSSIQVEEVAEFFCAELKWV